MQDIVDSPLWVEKGQSAAKVRKAVIAACAEQGWVIQEEKGNRIRAKLIQRTHEAVVDIPYAADKYSIIYVSSANLAYEDGKIHTRYNSWVKNLSKAIELEISRNR